MKAFKEGKITINDLEMAGILYMVIALDLLIPMKQRHCRIYTDNQVASIWAANLISSSDSAISWRLIRALAMRQRTTESAMPHVLFWPGSKNILPDNGTRSFKKFHSGPFRGASLEADTDFLTLFALSFPVPPQSKPC